MLEEWIRESLVPRYMTYEGIGAYGYHWWHTSVLCDGEKLDMSFALGYCGQFIIIVPKLDMVIVITGDLKDSMVPLRIVKEFLGGNENG